MSTEDSWLCTPLAVYDEVFGKYGLLGNEKFCSLIEEAVAANLSRIPLINVTPLDSIPDGHLVCVQGMVQDMFNMELFMDDFRVNTADSLNRRSFRFRDFDSLQLDDAEDPSGVHFSERQSLYIVPVPGESSWVQSIRLSRCKYVPCPTEVGVKRSIFPKNEDMPTEAKKAKGRETSSSKLKPGKQFPLSEEEEDETKVGVLVRVYDEMKDVLKINELVQVYGILEHARLGSVFPPEDFAPEGKGPEPIPRVHSIVLKRLRHINPLLMETASLTTSLEPGFPKVLTESPDRLRTSSAREDLFTSLLECFKGDALTAEYTLLHLVSSGISSDQIADSPYPNNLPALNIVCPLTVDHGATNGGVVKSTEKPSSLLVNRLRLLLPCLVTQFAPIKLTLESLNTGPSLMPIRDAAKGALDAGRLQLPDGTEVFVDETDMTVGQLQPRGLLNFRALSLLATQQRVPYDFQFYSQDWKTECRVLIISTGPSLIKPTLTVPWIEKPDLIPHDCTYDQSDLRWMDIRRFITTVASSDKQYSIEPSLQKRVNDDFVKWRRDKETYIDADDFAVMLCLLRLRCLTYGEEEATLEQWEKVCELEKQRRGRLMVSKNQVATM